MLQQTPGPKRHGRKELVQWLNATLALELQAVEDTRNGAVACLLLDRARPGSIDLSKVDWAADAHAPVLRNYKLLQAGLARARVDRPVDVDGLARGTHRACLEFMQWFKRFSDATPCLDAYDPAEARRRCKGGTPAPARPRAGLLRRPRRRRRRRARTSGRRGGATSSDGCATSSGACRRGPRTSPRRSWRWPSADPVRQRPPAAPPVRRRPATSRACILVEYTGSRRGIVGRWIRRWGCRGLGTGQYNTSCETR